MTGDNPAPSGAASADEAPPLGVHVLSEFTFCPRAGLIAMGLERADWGDDFWLRPNLDYRPSYAFYELRRAILGAFVRSLLLGIAWSGVLAGCLVLFHSRSVLPLAAGVILLLVLLVPLYRSLARLTAHLGEWRRIRSLTPREPDPDVATTQPIVWWELLRAGFDPVRLPEPLRSQASGLTGQPWRILRKGDLRIPVFRVAGDGPGRLYPKHTVRAAAYCVLLERMIGVRSPYAIALFEGTYNGWTFPNTAEARGFFEKVLDAARATLRPDAGMGPAATERICAGCPHGAPRLYRRAQSETYLFGEIVRPYGRVARDGQVYHSTCGDRFGWTPPHDELIVLGIAAPRPFEG